MHLRIRAMRRCIQDLCHDDQPDFGNERPSRHGFAGAVAAGCRAHRPGRLRLAGEASELTGERDRNYHLRAGDAHYVLKVSNPAEDPQVIDFQTRALLHIAAVDPGLPVPGFYARWQPADWLLEGPGRRRGWSGCSRSCKAFPCTRLRPA
ncbi:phosphotransferase [Bosea thiooxidans]